MVNLCVRCYGFKIEGMFFINFEESIFIFLKKKKEEACPLKKKKKKKTKDRRPLSGSPVWALL